MCDRHRPAGVKTGEERQHTTNDPWLLMPGDNPILACMNKFRQALRETENGTVMAIEVSAGSSRDIFPSGFNEWRNAIGCHIRPAPLEGRANKAVISLISKVLCIPRSQIHIISGATSSQKKILIEGMEEEALASNLEKKFV